MKILIVQTAFIGDVILATSLVENLALEFDDSKIDFLLRKGNEGLLANNPNLNEVLIWDKKNSKYKELFAISKRIRENQYDLILNLQRFASTGFLLWRSKAKQKIGFKKNPFSFTYHQKIEHSLSAGAHEIDRNYKLIESFVKSEVQKPKLYPSTSDFDKIESLNIEGDYVVLAPASVWFTKQLPFEKWLELINGFSSSLNIFLIGGPGDKPFLNRIVDNSKSSNIANLAGDLSYLESAALMKNAEMNFVNDSGPLHIASAMNAKVKAFFCSTIPGFGFGPLSDDSEIIQIQESLSCRPCGLHGHKECPKGHFECGNKIDVTISI